MRDKRYIWCGQGGLRGRRLAKSAPPSSALFNLGCEPAVPESPVSHRSPNKPVNATEVGQDEAGPRFSLMTATVKIETKRSMNHRQCFFSYFSINFKKQKPELKKKEFVIKP